ncbi:MAG: hypothetical protein ACOYBP_05055 [Microbacteriaceae bacterium]
MLDRFAQFVVNNRRRLPRWAQAALNSVSQNPYSMLSQVSAFTVRGPAAPPTEIPDTEIRVYIAPTNYAGQGYQWARSLERAEPRLGARNVAVRIPGGFAFPTDTSVSLWESTYARSWAAAEWSQATRFSHVLVEAERPLFGPLFRHEVQAEVRALRERGISVAFLSHGTDIRDPERHVAEHSLSPYRLDPRTAHLTTQARTNRELLAELGGPVFVSTPDLLEDFPAAHWCPVVVDTARFSTSRPPLSERIPRVIHISSDPIQKGSDLAAEAMAPLVRAGLVDFEVIEGVPSADIPQVLADADIVLDQFRLASYGVAACEAMAAGRIVIGNVSEQVRRQVTQQTKLELPIIQSLPNELPSVIERVLAASSRYQEHAQLGAAFSRSVHSGSRSARALLEHWIRQG